MQKHIAIIGAGPAGLTAAYQLAKQQIPVTVLEANPEHVGGVARTEVYKDYAIDICSNGFISKSAKIENMWAEMLPHDLFKRGYSSRLYYGGEFFTYPLRAFEILKKRGFTEFTRCVLSKLKARFSHEQSTDLYIWASQQAHKQSSIQYPRKGTGMLWEACKDKILQQGGQINMGKTVCRCDYNLFDKQWTIYFSDANGNISKLYATHLISSAPLRDLVLDYLRPVVAPPVLTAARELQYHHFLMVVLILKDRHQFSDHCLDIQDPRVDVTRIQNFKAWSSEMVPYQHMCSYGMEYTCLIDDKTWSTADEDLIRKASNELIKLGLATKEDIIDGCVLRQPKAYAVCDGRYKENISAIRRELDKRFPTLYLVGKNGMHNNNNQDHAMLTAMLTVDNIIAGKIKYDPWHINLDAVDNESGKVNEMSLFYGLEDVPEHPRS